ncbi:MAG: helix-turn-helix domain-containing protein [Oscillospiraceae bacterium]|jgi:transcriptional regulator with XRE-family HTH domain|nr:helix-turn-helix domain-containing protein [Oscillospiraceae bacterium]
MSITISENLKKLRRASDLTQEELAEIIGVSPQTVSKWERGENFPDITFLPALANYFEVTVDDLLGMAEIRDAKRVADAEARHMTLSLDQKFDEITEMWRELARDMPHNYEVQLRYATQLAQDQVGQFSFTPEDYLARKQPAITIFEHILEKCTDDGIRNRVYSQLSTIYNNCGDAEKAYAYADRLPEFLQCRENLRMNIAQLEASRYQSGGSVLNGLGIDPDELKDLDEDAKRALVMKKFLTPREREPIEYDPEVVEGFLNEIRQPMRQYASHAGIALRNLVTFKSMFGVDRGGEYLEMLKTSMVISEIMMWDEPQDADRHSGSYFNLAQEYMKTDHAAALDYAVKAIEDMAKFPRLDTQIGSGTTIDEDGHVVRTESETIREMHLRMFDGNEVFDPIRNDPRFVAAMAKLRGEV